MTNFVLDFGMVLLLLYVFCVITGFTWLAIARAWNRYKERRAVRQALSWFHSSSSGSGGAGESSRPSSDGNVKLFKAKGK